MGDGGGAAGLPVPGLEDGPAGPWQVGLDGPPLLVPEPKRRLLILTGETMGELFDALPVARFAVQHAADSGMLLRRLIEHRFDVGVIEHGRGIGDALELLDQAERQAVTTPIVVIADRATLGWRLQALDRGAALVLARGAVTADSLAEAIQEAIARRRRADRLRRQAQRDDLTGLANRAQFADRLRRALAATRRRNGHLAVMVLDLNGFKAVNDRLGHGAGDALLRMVGERLIGRVRATDTVARLGGDEFALLIEELARPDHAPIVAGKLLDAIGPPYILEAGPAEVTASLGVALFPRDSEEPETLLRLADAAMYRAKREGGNRCRFHDPNQDARADQLTSLRDEIRELIDSGGLVLRFQPQLTLRSGSPGLVGRTLAAAPGRRQLDETALRRAAEDASLLEPLTEWSLAAACEQLRRWRQTGLRGMHLAIPILSQRQLRWSDLCQRLAELVRTTGAEPRELEIELDERLLRDELAAGGQSLEGLRRLGVRLAVDDFGSAGGAVSLLADAGLSTVKLGPTLLDRVPADSSRLAVAVGVMRLARQLGLRLVGAGVQTREQMRLLRAEGADAVQDLLRGPPLQVEPATEWLFKAIQRR